MHFFCLHLCGVFFVTLDWSSLATVLMLIYVAAVSQSECFGSPELSHITFDMKSSPFACCLMLAG